MEPTPDQFKQFVKAYKRLFKGVCGAWTMADFRKQRRLPANNPEMIMKCATNRERRRPMFEAMQDRAAKAREFYSKNYLFQRFEHSNLAPVNGAQYP